MSSVVEDDPLSNSGISQPESETRPETTNDHIPTEGILPTSSVFNLSSYDMDQVQNPEPKYCCEMDRTFATLEKCLFIPSIDPSLDELRQQPKPVIVIEDASKAHDMSGKPFISYLIKTTLQGYRMESKHRYSEFESLRKLLVNTYPFVVVPPIPDKHSVVAYAAKPGKALQDPKIIQKRKILLQSFLNRVASHPNLQGCHEFHIFLMGDTPWSEVVANGSPRLTKKSSIASLALETRSLRKPDPHFSAAQDYTLRFGNQVLFIRKLHKKMITLYQEQAAIYTELGGLYNGWSLTEHVLSQGIEQVGQAIDSTLTSTNILYTSLDEWFGDCLLEYEKFSVAISQLLLSRHKAHVEFETISENLIQKQQLISKLESSEHESQRLAAILAVEGQPPIPISRPTGFMAQLNSLLDNDPEATRRNTISKTKDLITQLEDSREQSRIKLLQLNGDIQRDLDRFQKQKVVDFKKMMIAFCLAQKEFHSRAIAAWSSTKNAIDIIDTSGHQ